MTDAGRESVAHDAGLPEADLPVLVSPAQAACELIVRRARDAGAILQEARR
jgi:hypothetical protein